MTRAGMFTPFSLNIRGTLHEFLRPQIMGILNITPDSFYAKSRTSDVKEIESRVRQMLSDRVDMIDIGAYSSRLGANDIPSDEEIHRLQLGLKIVRDISPDIPVSVDTFRAEVAYQAIESGADIINDISGGNLDKDMFSTIARLNVPYILMHMRGTPSTMSDFTEYDNVTADVIKDLSYKLGQLSAMGVNDVIVDPGFGFAKTTEQNFAMMQNLEAFHALNCPLLVGISRKSMIYSSLGITPDDALNGTTVLNTLALLSGTAILRVHDVKEAVQTLKLLQLTHNYFQYQ